MNTADDRLLALDVLRGVAVLGILLLNIIAFSMPEAAYVNPGAWGGTGIADIGTWVVMFVLFDGKMRALFSMLFGASMLLVIDRAEMAGRNGRREQVVRALWLLAFGIAHFVLLWWGDILMLYALVGLVALRFAGKAPLSLVKAAFIAFAAHFLIAALFTANVYAFRNMASAPGASLDTIRAYRDFAASLGMPGTEAVGDALTLYRSDYGTIVAASLADLPATLIASLMFLSIDTLGFMLLGMAMLKGGFLTGEWEGEQYRRTARHCFLIGVPPMLALAAWVILSGYEAVTAFGAFMAWSFPFRIPLAVGWAALILLLIQRAPSHWLVTRLAAAGRMAFSNYLATSLLMTAFFYGWGFALFGTINRAPVYGVVLGMWALILLWSKPWLDRFAYGPMEWLWRSLVRGRPVPMQKRFAPN